MVCLSGSLRAIAGLYLTIQSIFHGRVVTVGFVTLVVRPQNSREFGSTSGPAGRGIALPAVIRTKL